MGQKISVSSILSTAIVTGTNESAEHLSERGDEAVYRFNPLFDARWNRFLSSHPNSSVFHSSAWLRALQSTYGYTPLAFTTSPPNAELSNAVVFCLVDSWLTGKRLVSLPFSDHCELLTSEPDWVTISSKLSDELRQQKLRYIEFRSSPGMTIADAPRCEVAYCTHRLDLGPSIDEIFKNFHKDSIQRKIRRAQREGLAYEEGQSDSLLAAFDQLWLMTRRRHLAPPQPARWFRNLVQSFGQALKIRVAFKSRHPIAAVLTLQYKDHLLYKYGCSDAAFHPLGGIHFLLWQSILEAKRGGMRVFDFGRSDVRHEGLITFKGRWGTDRSEVNYVQVLGATGSRRDHTHDDWRINGIAQYTRYLPDSLFRAFGTLVYPHIG